MPRGRKSRGKLDDKTTGKLKERKFGLRIDDDVEVYIIAGDQLRIVKGRVLDYKKDLHLEDSKGFYHKISFLNRLLIRPETRRFVFSIAQNVRPCYYFDR